MRWVALVATIAGALAAGCSRPHYLAAEHAAPGAADVNAGACLAYGVPGDAAGRTLFLQDAQLLGVKRVRYEISWAWVEKQKGVFDFSAFDAGVEALAQAKLDQILILDYGNPLYSAAGHTNGDDPMYPPDDPADFARYVAAIVGRYGDRVKKWEVWNEENSGFRFWKPDADAAGYARLLEAASAAVKAACADCQVILGAPVSIPYTSPFVVPAGADFIRAVRAAGGVDYDAVGVHPYMLYPPCSPPEGGKNACEFWSRDEVSFQDQLAQIREAAGPVPVHATEYGWPTFKPPSGKGEVTEAVQAAWLVRGTLLIAAGGGASACWFTWRDDDRSGSFPPEGDFGLRARPSGGDGAPKASYQAFAMLYLAGHGSLRFVRDRAGELGLQKGEHALLFDARDGNVTFLWREETVPRRTVKVPLHGASSLSATSGSPAQLDVDANGENAFVPLAPHPVAVVPYPKEG